MPKGIDGEDLAEIAQHDIHKLTAEGWIVQDIDKHIVLEAVRKHGRQLPISLEMTVRFVPSRPK